MRLNVTELGDGPPVMLVHGLFGQSRNWGAIQRELARSFRVLAPDLRNHGDSPRAPGMDHAALAADLADTLHARGAAGAAVVGHSLGGKAALALALRHGGLVGRLVVADIAPRRYPPHLRGHVAAMRALPLTPGMSRKEADAALAPAIPDAGVRGFLLQSLDLAGEAPRWKLGLPEIAAAMPDIEGWDETGHFEGEMLVLAGGRSGYVRAEDHEAFRRLCLRACFATLPEAGHWLHAEDPRGFLAALHEFL